MNREYAYSRDKGKCKCCGNAFSPMLQKNCHHVKNKLPLDRINKVPNLVWLCEPCHRMVHNSPIPPELNAKTVGKIMKYREKLKTWNLQPLYVREDAKCWNLKEESKSIWWYAGCAERCTPGVRWGKTWRLLQKVTYHNKADYSADCFAAAEVLHILLVHENA